MCVLPDDMGWQPETGVIVAGGRVGADAFNRRLPMKSLPHEDVDEPDAAPFDDDLLEAPEAWALEELRDLQLVEEAE